MLQTYIMSGWSVQFCVCVCVWKLIQYRVLSGEYNGNNSSLQLRPINSPSDSATCLSVLALVALDTHFLSMYCIQKRSKSTAVRHEPLQRCEGSGKWRVSHLFPCTAHTRIQGDSWLVDITAGDSFLGLCDKKVPIHTCLQQLQNTSNSVTVENRTILTFLTMKT
jgi:hypothetical protein